LEATASQISTPRGPDSRQHQPSVVVSGVDKAFRLPHQRYSTLKERALHPLTRSSDEVLQALHDVTFEVGGGEFFGIVGRNGSGKSTLLKCLAGIYGVDRGDIHLDGRVSPFIELGVGFNPDLTARDNVVINAIMLGLSRKEANRRFDEIIAFAELEDFVDLKLKNYSSGMAVRLGFSVAIEVDAEVLLIDEVLAVGDASFQHKCFDQFEQMRADKRTILFVTHDMGAVERFCDRAMLLEEGRILEIGPPDEIARRYSEVNFGKATPDGSLPAGMLGSEAWVRTVHCEDEAGERLISQQRGERCTVVMEVEFATALDDPVFAVVFRNDVRHIIFVATTLLHGPTGHYDAGERVTVRLSFENRLAPSRYTLSPTIGTWDPDYRLIDEKEDVSSLIVDAHSTSGGVVDIPTTLEITRA
jgi:ABC-type polysaccharide/polyol phosphate transport system ATPase subunit